MFLILLALINSNLCFDNLNIFNDAYNRVLSYSVNYFTISNYNDCGYCIVHDEDGFFNLICGSCISYSSNFIGKFFGEEMEPDISANNWFSGTEYFFSCYIDEDNRSYIATGRHQNSYNYQRSIYSFDEDFELTGGWMANGGALKDVCKIGSYYYVCGYYDMSTNPGVNMSKQIYKFDTDLVPVDSLSFDNNTGSYWSISPTHDDCIIVIGSNYDTFGLIKCDTNLNIIWGKNYGGSSVSPTEDGGYITVGDAGGYLLYLRKVDSTGSNIWIEYYGNSFDYKTGYDVKQDCFDRGFILVGSVSDSSSTDYDAYVLKTDSLGNEDWSIIIDGNSTLASSDDDIAYSCDILNKDYDEYNHYYITGCLGIYNGYNHYDVFEMTINVPIESEKNEIVLKFGNENILIPLIQKITMKNDEILYEFFNPNRENLEFSIFNSIGQKVFSYNANQIENFSWNKIDNFGNTVPAGSYFAVVENGMSRFSKSFVILE